MKKIICILEDIEFFGLLKNITVKSAANIIPLQGEWKGCIKPLLQLIGKRGQLFYVNPFEDLGGGYNCAVVGKTGTGKSVLMLELVTSLLSSGGQAIIIDDGRSFMNACLVQNGSFIEFNNSNPICINPFSIVCAERFFNDPEYKEEVIQLLNLILRSMARSESNTSDVENAFIQEAIYITIASKGLSGEITDIAEYLKKHKDKRAQDIGNMLFPFTKDGMYKSYFSGEANLTLDNKLYVFEFEKIKNRPDLQRVVLMVLMFLVTEKMFRGDRSAQVSLIIDEAWSLLHGAGVKDFIEGIARRARKYSGNIITGTQSIDDYYKNQASVAVIQNTDWFFLLGQNAESIEAIKKSGRILLTDAMEHALKNLRTVSKKYSEVEIVFNNGVHLGIEYQQNVGAK